jgi:hypothetical protein
VWKGTALPAGRQVQPCRKCREIQAASAAEGMHN